MTKLIDVVKTVKAPEFKPLMDEMLEDLKVRDTINDLIHTRGLNFNTMKPTDSLVQEAICIEEKLEKVRNETFFNYGGNLPQSIMRTIELNQISNGKVLGVNNLFAEDTFAMASKLQKSTTQELRRIADKLGFIIVPFTYVTNPIITMAENKDLINPVLEFNESMCNTFDIFILGPISIYDMSKHISSKGDKILYWDLSNPTISAVEMILPALRELSKRVSTIEEKVNSLEESVGQMTTQLENLERQIAENKLAIAQEAKENAALSKRLTDIKAQSFSRRDPLVFAVPKETNIREDNTFAILGPCWGEDFEDIVLESLGLL
jgi:hypothetical protein